MRQAVTQTTLGKLPVRRGKVRDIYDLGSDLLLVATDRISAFDWVLPTGIPDKGRVLAQTSAFWFRRLDEPHHMKSTEISEVNLPSGVDPAPLVGRSMLVHKTEVVPIECVVRGYLSGSGWKEYQKDGTVCGIRLPAGLKESDKLPEPVFTPATKAETGHDENISEQQMAAIVGPEVTAQLREVSLTLYQQAAEYARERGIIIADTKFEFGRDGQGRAILIDEVLTPDSSRFWPADDYEVGRGQASFDKQYVRDYLETLTWNKQPPAPELPPEISQATTARYLEAYELLTGEKL